MGGVLQNTGLIFGDGRINSVVINQLEGGQIQVTGFAPLIFTSQVHNNGLVSVVDGTVNFLGGLSNVGTLGISTGNSQISGDITNVGGDGNIAVGGLGIATFFGNVTNEESVNVAAGSRAVFIGNVDGSGFYPGLGTVEFLGRFGPGSSPGVNSFGGDVVFGPASNPILEVQAPAGATPVAGVDHDLIAVTGSVSLDGVLDVVLLSPESRPAVGVEFEVMRYGSRSAGTMFNQIHGTQLDTGYALAPRFSDTTGDGADDALIVRASIPGDLNLDNRVSVADLSTFALHFNTTPGLYDELLKKNGWELGDFNGDGGVTVADLSLLALNFGFDLGAGEAATGLSLAAAARLAGIDPAAVPEPGVWGVVMAGFGVVRGGHRRRGRSPS